MNCNARAASNTIQLLIPCKAQNEWNATNINLIQIFALFEKTCFRLTPRCTLSFNEAKSQIVVGKGKCHPLFADAEERYRQVVRVGRDAEAECKKRNKATERNKTTVRTKTSRKHFRKLRRQQQGKEMKTNRGNRKRDEESKGQRERQRSIKLGDKTKTIGYQNVLTRKCA